MCVECVMLEEQNRIYHTERTLLLAALRLLLVTFHVYVTRSQFKKQNMLPTVLCLLRLVQIYISVHCHYITVFGTKQLNKCAVRSLGGIDSIFCEFLDTLIWVQMAIYVIQQSLCTLTICRSGTQSSLTRPCLGPKHDAPGGCLEHFSL